MGPIGNDLIENFPSLNWKASDLKAVLEKYKEHRNSAEKAMGRYDDPGHLHVIDRHKVGAAFMLAILEVAPLRLQPGCSERLEGERVANAKLAFQTAVRIIGAFARLEARKNDDNDALNRWNRPVTYPRPRDGKDFRHHAYRALHHGHRQGRLNLPLLAMWLFTIEQYNNCPCRTASPPP